MAPTKNINVKVNSMDAELEFAVTPATTGKQLFDQVVKTIGVRELWYFGLYHKDSAGQDAWVKLDKKLKDLDLPKDKLNPEFFFRAKFFPEDATDELIQDITIKLFYLQVKESILSDSTYCPAEAAVLLASYAMQAKYGDQENRHVDDIQKDIEVGRVLPKRVREQHPTFTPQDWAKKISEWHGEHKEMEREESMKEYLKIAQDLDMYGVTYYAIKNKKGTDLFLGVDALGINVYEKDNKLTPRIGFPWSEIRNISFTNKNFTIRPIDSKSPDFVIRVDKMKTNKNILAICMGNHELYLRRRKPDSIEVQQMRAEAEAIRKKKQGEKEKIKQEKRAREEMEARYKELQDRLSEAEQQAMERERQLNDELKAKEQENSMLRSNLNDIQTDIERMEAERSDLLTEKESLAKRVSEGDVTKEEYARRMLEIQEEYKEVQDKLKSKEEEAESLKDNLVSTQAEKDEEVLRLQQEMDERLAAASISASVSSAGDASAYDEKEEAEVQLSNEGVANMDSELGRITAVEKDQTLNDKLKELSSDLDAARKEEKLTSMDVIHKDNVKKGRDKYKTLNLIRKGNTKSRVNEFEAM